MSHTENLESESAREIQIPAGNAQLEGELSIPEGATGIVLFAHGSGSGRHSPRNRFVARTIRKARIGTLLFDLLTPEEESVEFYTRHLRFDINMLAERLAEATRWLKRESNTWKLRVGYFGASTGAGAALVAAAELGTDVSAVVSRGGRPDLAREALPLVTAPTLLIVGERDEPVIELNEHALWQMRSLRELRIVAGAAHLFEEPGALKEVASLATDWFRRHLAIGLSVEA